MTSNVPNNDSRPRTALICHGDTPLDQVIIAKMLHAAGQLCAVVVIDEGPSAFRGRIKREMRRVGILRFLDVLSFRIFYEALFARSDRRWQERQIEEANRTLPELPAELPIHHTETPNSPETELFLEKQRPDLVLARCKFILKQRIFSIPTVGTYVLHPGVCPEYRNAHGCFWALANDDSERVGLTLLRIDEGIDTGPVYAYYRTGSRLQEGSHIRIQDRLVFDNLTTITEDLQALGRGDRIPLDTHGRESNVWGQPWLTLHIRWKLRDLIRRLKNA